MAAHPKASLPNRTGNPSALKGACGALNSSKDTMVLVDRPLGGFRGERAGREWCSLKYSCQSSSTEASGQSPRTPASLTSRAPRRCRVKLPLGLVGQGVRRLSLALAIAWMIGLLVATAPTLTPWPDAIFITDFSQFWTSAWIIRDGATPMLFDMNVQAAFTKRLILEAATTDTGRSLVFRDPYFYPPPLALLFVSLTILPLPWAFATWSIVSLLLFATAVALPLRSHPLRGTLAAAMLSYLGVIMTLREGQMNALLPLSLTLSMLALSRGQPFLGGVLIGLLWLKPQYAVLLPLVFLFKRRWRELGGMMVTGLALASLSFAMLGTSGMIAYFEVLRGVGRFHPSLYTWQEVMINWRALIMGLAPDLPETAGSALMLTAGAATGLLTLLAWRGDWDPESPIFPIQLLVTVLATIIATPHSHFYGTVLALAPVAAMMSRPVAPVLRPWIWYLLGLGYLLPLLRIFFQSVPPWWLAPYYFVAMLLLTLHVRKSNLTRLGASGAATRTPATVARLRSDHNMSGEPGTR